MSDYYPLLSRMVGGLANNTGETRRALYSRARAALCEQLRGREPPLTDSEITRERLSLEAAIRKFEAEAIRRPRGAPVPESIATPNAEEIGAIFSNPAFAKFSITEAEWKKKICGPLMANSLPGHAVVEPPKPSGRNQLSSKAPPRVVSHGRSNSRRRTGFGFWMKG